MGYYYVDKKFTEIQAKLALVHKNLDVSHKIWNLFRIYLNYIQKELNNYPTGLIPSKIIYSAGCDEYILMTINIKFTTSIYDDTIKFTFYKNGTCGNNNNDTWLLHSDLSLRRRAWIRYAELNLTTNEETENFRGTPDELCVD